jgi:hypothetical protein
MRTAEKDQNYLSLNRDTIVWFAGTPAERPDPGPLSQPLELIPDDPKEWDSCLKCSGRTGTVLRGAKVAQGKENTLDLNNKCSGLIFDGSWGIVGVEGERVFTIKGGSYNIGLKGPVYSRGTKADVDIGNWSDQSFATTHDLDLSGLYRVDGKPLTVIFGRVNRSLLAALGRPTDIVLPRNCKVLFWASLAEQVYWWAKRLAVQLKLVKTYA